MIQGLGNRKVLGVSVGDRSLTVAQVHGSSAGGRVGKTGVFLFAEGQGWEKPEELGKAFGAWLRAEGFGTRLAVVGLPAHWTLLESRSVPDVAEGVVQNVIRMVIEREYQPEGKEWVFDYARYPRAEGETGQEGQVRVALAATALSRLAMIKQMAVGAGLRVPLVTSTMLAMMAGLPGEGGRPTVVLHAREDGVEAGVMTREGVKGVEWAWTGYIEEAGLGDELKRLTAGLLSATVGGGINVVAYCTQAGQEPAVRKALGLAGLAGTQGAGRLVVKASAETVFSASVALGEMAVGVGRGGQKTLVNFAKSRLLIDTGAVMRRRRILAVAVGLIVLATVAFCVNDWYLKKGELADKVESLARGKDLLATDQAQIDKLEKARGWLDKRPSILDQVRAFTMAMPSGGQVWATSISIRDDKTGTFIGKAQSEKGVIELLDKLRGTGRFVDVKLLYLRQADRTGKSVSFALTFAIKAQE
jgi:hypothetical protein